VRTFEYDITDFKNIYAETYIFDPVRDTAEIREHTEHFIEFLQYARSRTTDEKIFGGDVTIIHN
jgi:hypothetical protein